ITGSITGPEFLQVIAYQLFGPAIFVLCAVVLGSRTIAAPEEAGLLELTVALPVDRRRLVLDRFAALALGVLAVAGATVGLVLILNSTSRIGADPGNIVAAHAGVYLVALFFGTMSLTVGAATGSRAATLWVTGSYALGGYLIETLGRSVPAISWLRWL